MPYADPDREREYHRAYSKRWAEENREKLNEAQRARRSTPEGKKEWAAYMREWRKGKKASRYHLARRVKREYGLTLEAYDAMLAGGCAICGASASGIDHCHTHGVVRGALCNGCNSGLGMFADNPRRLLAAVEYLRRLPA